MSDKKAENTTVNKKDFEKQKIELVKLRIKNKYYEKDTVLQQLVSDIFQNEIKK